MMGSVKLVGQATVAASNHRDIDDELSEGVELAA
jgi:hypothetical protein